MLFWFPWKIYVKVNSVFLVIIFLRKSMIKWPFVPGISLDYDFDNAADNFLSSVESNISSESNIRIYIPRTPSLLGRGLRRKNCPKSWPKIKSISWKSWLILSILTLHTHPTWLLKLSKAKIPFFTDVLKRNIFCVLSIQVV